MVESTLLPERSHRLGSALGQPRQRRSSPAAGRAGRKLRLAILAPHVVQYHAPIYRKLAESDLIEPHVFYLDAAGHRAVNDPTMGATIAWDIPLLEGYSYEFLRNWSPNLMGPPWLSRINPRIVPRILNGKWDAVLIQGYHQLSCWLALASARFSGTKVLFRGEAALRIVGTGVRERIKTSVLRSVFALSDAVLYSCGGNRTYFEHYGCPPEKLAPIPCAVDNDYFRRMREHWGPSKAAIKVSLGIPADLPVVLNVSRLEDYKRQADLLAAVAKLQRDGLDFATIFVGDGPDRDILERGAAASGLRQTHFIGFVNQSEVSKYYTIGDIFVLCSSNDPSPKAVNEALNFELPLVCSDRPGTVGDVIVHGKNAVVYPCGNADRLARALKQLLLDPNERSLMGRASLQLADDWSLEKDVQCLEDVMQRLIPLTHPVV